MSSAAPQVPISPAQPGAKQRVALWDNARFLLIVLVVVGHTLSTIRVDTALAYGIYTYIFLFHMPAMILLAGMFSRADTSPKAVRSTLQLIVTWVLWEFIWAGIHGVVEGRPPVDSFLVSPAWTLWFLVSLATMRIILPYLVRLRHPLLVSLGLALGSGIFPLIGTEFSASRTLAFLPFFVAGWLIRDRGWLAGDWFVRPSRTLRAVAWGSLGAVALVFVLTPRLRDFWLVDEWLTWRESYYWLFENAPIGDWQPTQWGEIVPAGVLITAGLIAIAALLTFAFLVVAPRGHSVITVWGTRTLYVYLLHGPIVWLLREYDAIAWLDELGTLGILMMVAGSCVLAVLLSAAWVSRVFRPVIEPRFDWVYAPKLPN